MREESLEEEISSQHPQHKLPVLTTLMRCITTKPQRSPWYQHLVAWLGRSHWPLTALSMVSSFINMALPLILVRLLGREEVGIFKVFFLYLSLFPLLSGVGGIMNGLFYWAGQKDEQQTTIQTSGVLLLAAASLWIVLSFLFFDPLMDLTGWNAVVLSCFIVSMLGALAGPFFEDSAIATGRIWTGALFLSGFEIVRTSAIVVAVLTTKSLTTVLLVHVVTSILRVVCGYLWATHFNLFSLRLDWTSVKKVLVYATPLSIAWAFGVFIKSADQLILSTIVNPEAFALYSIGCLSIPPLFIYEQSITRVLIPRLAKSFADKEHIKAASLFREAVANLSLIYIPAVVGLAVFAHPIIHILFTPEYADAAFYLEIFSLSYLLNIFPYDSVARAQGDSPWIMRTFVAFSIITALLVYPTTLIAGPRGALISFLVIGTALRLYALRYSLKRAGWSLHSMFPFSSLAKASFLSVFLGLLCFMTKHQFSSQTWWFLVCGPLFGLSYFPLYAGLSSLLRLWRPLPRNVLVITQKIDIGGLERTILSLTRSLQETSDWRCLVFAYDQPSHSPEQSLNPLFQKAGVEVAAFDKGKGFSLRVVAKIAWYILSRDFRIIHTQDLGSLMYASCAKVLTCFGVRIIHTQHSFVHLTYQSRYAFYEKLFTKFADRITVVSEPLRESYKQLGFKQGNILKIENGIAFPSHLLFDSAQRCDLRQQLLCKHLPDDKALYESLTNMNWLLYLARLYPGKGQDKAIELWNKLPSQIRQNTSLLFVGPESKKGERERLTLLAREALDSSHIKFMGETQSPEIWLQASDIFLSCSEYEGMPIGPLEAAGSGIPTALSDIAGHQLLHPYSPCILDNDRNRAAEQLAELLGEIGKNAKDYRTALWEKGAELRRIFSTETMTVHYREVYEEVRLPVLSRGGLPKENL
jgi:O-antigen/teichoic acid export membrane protein/glycosyltransferase involved in cell wall biosynthesis